MESKGFADGKPLQISAFSVFSWRFVFLCGSTAFALTDYWRLIADDYFCSNLGSSPFAKFAARSAEHPAEIMANGG